MKLNAYCLLDVKAGAFAPPFFMHHDSQAIRAVSELGRDLSTTVGRYPSDFALCRIGAFDDANGQLVPMQTENLGLVVGFISQQQADAPRLPLFPLNGQHGPAAGVDANGEVN